MKKLHNWEGPPIAIRHQYYTHWWLWPRVGDHYQAFPLPIRRCIPACAPEFHNLFATQNFIIVAEIQMRAVIVTVLLGRGMCWNCCSRG